ncbi:lytic transglycosylase domain-containing protein [Mesorhizobium sp. BAC0120]|uniref:lytic transglycosylase domain-containing protein n=1 Tax=Mesorhizobium sp. BAC0120 TaxID=3090670 RepID=UPI00298BDD9B|nr:lytic transglycosylase domain-containing protein [Mesorhizobium sp. BAC0120]MDW6022343.1 lytic transglycosylase domain-containing protein [Mesorhizobium sp. BAC0120]
MSAAVCLLASLLSCPYPYTEARLQPSSEYAQSMKRERLVLKRERLADPPTPIAARFGPDEPIGIADPQFPAPVIFTKVDENQEPDDPAPPQKKREKIKASDEPIRKLKTRTKIILETRTKKVETAYVEPTPIEQQWRLSSLFGISNASSAALSQSISGVSNIDMGKSGYQEVIRAARMHQVPVDLALRVAKQESGGDCGAISSAGARGVMQVMPKTGAKHGYSTRQLTNCRTGAEAGVKELKHLLQLAGGDVKQTLTGYNCGEDCMFGRRKKLPLETVNYIQAITRN